MDSDGEMPVRPDFNLGQGASASESRLRLGVGPSRLACTKSWRSQIYFFGDFLSCFGFFFSRF